MEAYKKELEEYNKSVASTLEKVDSWCSSVKLNIWILAISLIAIFNFSIGVFNPQLYFRNLNKNCSKIFNIHFLICVWICAFLYFGWVMKWDPAKNKNVNAISNIIILHFFHVRLPLPLIDALIFFFPSPPARDFFYVIIRAGLHRSSFNYDFKKNNVVLIYYGWIIRNRHHKLKSIFL